MKKIFTLLIVLVSLNSFSQEFSKLYLDKFSQPCIKEEAKYYQLVPLIYKKNKIIASKDCYISGETFAEGNYKNGKKIGIWVGYTKEGKEFFREKYKKGKMIKGSCYYNGEKYTYKDIVTHPNIEGGKEQFAVYCQNYLNKFIHVLKKKYPNKYLKLSKKKDHRVNINYTISKEGVVTIDKIISKSNLGFSIKLAKAMYNKYTLKYKKKWIPGCYRGIPINYHTTHRWIIEI